MTANIALFYQYVKPISKLIDLCDLNDLNYATNAKNPIAKAGSDQIVSHQVTLDGSESYDSDGQIVSYKWNLEHNQNNAYSKTAEGSNPTITNLQNGFYTVTLTVYDDDGFSSTDQMILAVYDSTCNGDVTGDGKVGLEEAINALQIVSGIK